MEIVITKKDKEVIVSILTDSKADCVINKNYEMKTFMYTQPTYKAINGKLYLTSDSFKIRG